MESLLEKPMPGELVEILLNFPGITNSYDQDQNLILQGTINLQKKWYRLRLVLPQFPKIDGFILFIRENQEYEKITPNEILELKLSSASDLILKVPEILISRAKNNSKNSSDHEQVTESESSECNIYSQIVGLFDPQSYKIELNEDCNYIRFSKFCNFEQHYLEMKLPTLKITKHSLPDGIPWLELFENKCFSLVSYIEQFQKFLQELQVFYDDLSSIDELCQVVQPVKITTKDNWRIFTLKKNVYLKLVIRNPLAPVSSMNIQIIGPTYEVANLRKVFSDGLTDWDYELDIHKNLLRIFDLCFFPMPSCSNKEEERCGICFCYDMDDDVPIISCDNPKCDLTYHPSCLKQWFNTLSNGKEFLDVSFGTCPFCKTNLSAQFVELLEK